MTSDPTPLSAKQLEALERECRFAIIDGRWSHLAANELLALLAEIKRGRLPAVAPAGDREAVQKSTIVLAFNHATEMAEASRLWNDDARGTLAVIREFIFGRLGIVDAPDVGALSRARTGSEAQNG